MTTAEQEQIRKKRKTEVEPSTPKLKSLDVLLPTPQTLQKPKVVKTKTEPMTPTKITKKSHTFTSPALDADYERYSLNDGLKIKLQEMPKRIRKSMTLGYQLPKEESSQTTKEIPSWLKTRKF